MIVIFGGYGTFGAHAARALAAAGLPLRIAGRDAARAASFAAGLGPEHEGIAADANDPASCARALAGARVAVSCAGPFSKMRPALPEACLETGVHYVDIADDRAWTARLRARDGEFRKRGLTAAVGCSSLPGISGALAVLAATSSGGPKSPGHPVHRQSNPSPASRTTPASPKDFAPTRPAASLGTFRATGQ